MADRIDKMIIRLESDERSAKRLISQIGQVRAAMYATAAAIKDTSIGAGRVERAFADYGKSAQAAGRRIDGLYDMIDQLRRETLAAAAAQDRLERSMRDVDVAAQKQERTLAATRAQQAMQETRGYRSVGEGGAALAALTSRVGLGSVGQGIYLGSDLSRSLGAIQRLPADLAMVATQAGLTTASLLPLGAALGAVGIAAAAYLIISRDTKKATEEQAAAIAAWRDSLREVTELLQTGTTQDVQDAIENKREQLRIAETQRDELQRIQDELEARARKVGVDLTKPLGADFIGLFSDIGDEYKKNKDALEEAESEVNSLTFSIERLSAGLADGATVANDVALWEEQAAERRKNAAQEAMAAIDTQIQHELAQRTKAASYTPEQVDRESKGLRDEINAINEALSDLDAERGGSVFTLQEIQQKERELLEQRNRAAAELDFLTSTVNAAAFRRQTAADAEKRLEQATSDAVKARDQAAAAEDKRATLLSTYASQTDEISRKRQIDDTREAEDFARKQAADRAKHNADLIALDRKHLEARAELVAKVAESSVGADKEQIDALRDFQKDEARATVRYWQDIRRINRDERLSVASAAARLDASAVWEAQQSAKQQREERTEQLELERKERAEDYKDRLDELAEQRDEKKRAAEQELRDLDDKHRQERQARIAAFNQQLAEEAADRRIRQQRLAQDRAYEDTLRQQQFNSELAAINSLIVAAEQLERQSRATILAGGANPVQTGGGGSGLSGTQQYYQQIAQSAATGRYVSWAGQRVRTDMYDPMQAAGMDVATYYKWKQRYGYAAGGYPPVGRDVLVGERGPEWVRFMQPAMVYPNGQRPPSAGGGTSNTVGDLTFNIYESGNPQRTAEVVTRYINELIGVG